MSPGASTRSSTASVLTRDELVAWGERFGRSAQPPLVVAMSGDLGAGKTTLIQAICRGFGVMQEVTSPTFALVHEYHGTSGAVFHLDLYRLRDPSELTNLGWDDIVNADALVLVEWAERAGTRLPSDVRTIHLAHVADAPGRRTLRLD